jgi:hypothetical protein
VNECKPLVPGGGAALLYRALPGAQGAGDITFGYTVSDDVARSKEVGRRCHQINFSTSVFPIRDSPFYRPS